MLKPSRRKKARLLLAPEGSWSDSGLLLKEPRKMVLLNEPRTQTYLAYSKFSSAQKNLRTFNPPVENILIGALP